MSDDRPNIVLVTVDSLRADHCGFMGYEEDTTPTLDAMAEEGVVFENAIAPAPYTEHSMPAVFTGEFVSPSDIENHGQHVAKRQFLPEMMSRRGYSTAGFSPNPFTSRRFGFERGFDEFRDFLGESSNTEVLRTMMSRLSSGDFVEALRLGTNMAGYSVPGFGNQSIPVRSYYRDILDWVDQADEPFFLWVFMLEVHSPYRPTREYRSMSFWQMLRLNLIRSNLRDRTPNSKETEQLLDLYDGTVKMTDGIVDDLLSDLSEYDPTLVFHSDHGEAFDDHGDFGHNERLYEENIHVPLLVGNGPSTGRISDPVSLRKIPELVTRIADGVDISSIAGEKPPVFARAELSKLAARGRTWKYLVDADEEEAQFFDLEANPTETDSRDDDPRTDHALEQTGTHLNTAREKHRILESSKEVSSI